MLLKFMFWPDFSCNLCCDPLKIRKSSYAWPQYFSELNLLKVILLLTWFAWRGSLGNREEEWLDHFHLKFASSSHRRYQVTTPGHVELQSPSKTQIIRSHTCFSLESTECCSFRNVCAWYPKFLLNSNTSNFSAKFKATIGRWENFFWPEAQYVALDCMRCSSACRFFSLLLSPYLRWIKTLRA
jgi:hypothetical protein